MKHLNKFLFMAFMTVSLLPAKAQSLVVVDPDNYNTKANPYVIPDLPSGVDYYLSVKGGEGIYITVNADKGTTVFYISNQSKTINQDTVFMYGNVGAGLINFVKNGNPSVISLNYHYQADIFDRTIGSSTFGKRPDFIWVNAGTSANISGGPSFGYYKWKTLNDVDFVGNATDSTRNFSYGTYIGRFNDNSMLVLNWSNDTISILEKPTLNNATKTLSFPTTTTGITYKMLNASNINGADTTWTETQNFVGDGNAKNIILPDGKYKLTTTFGIHTANYQYGYFVVGITTAIDKTKEENISFRVVDNKLQFDNEVNLKFYSLQGQLLQQEKGVSFKLVRKTGILTATDKNGNTLTTKIILK